MLGGETARLVGPDRRGEHAWIDHEPAVRADGDLDGSAVGGEDHGLLSRKGKSSGLATTRANAVDHERRHPNTETVHLVG